MLEEPKCIIALHWTFEFISHESDANGICSLVGLMFRVRWADEPLIDPNSQKLSIFLLSIILVVLDYVNAKLISALTAGLRTERNIMTGKTNTHIQWNLS